MKALNNLNFNNLKNYSGITSWRWIYLIIDICHFHCQRSHHIQSFLIRTDQYAAGPVYLVDYVKCANYINMQRIHDCLTHSAVFFLNKISWQSCKISGGNSRTNDLLTTFGRSGGGLLDVISSNFAYNVPLFSCCVHVSFNNTRYYSASEFACSGLMSIKRLLGVFP